MAETKKLLVAFEPSYPDEPSSDFLVPLNIGGHVTFYGLKSGAFPTFGLVVYTGKAVTEEDIVLRLMDARENMDDCQHIKRLCELYIRGLHHFRIGNVLCISETDEMDILQLVAGTPSAFMKRFNTCHCSTCPRKWSDDG